MPSAYKYLTTSKQLEWVDQDGSSLGIPTVPGINYLPVS